MASYWKLFAAATVSAALLGAASTASASPPVGSKGCEVPAGNRVVGKFTHSTWPISQKRRLDGSAIGRTYTVHVPSQHRGATPLPIVFDLHVAFSSGFQQDLASEMSAKGAAEGFIVVQPDSWPWWAALPMEEALRGGASDVEYIRLLLDAFDQNLCFDRNRIFVAGGGFIGVMAPVLACASVKGELGAHRIAAVATVSTFAIPTSHAPAWEKMPRREDYKTEQAYEDAYAKTWLNWLSNKWVRICPERGRDFLPLMVIVSDNDLRLASLIPADTAKGTDQPPDTPDSAMRTELARFIGRKSARPPAEERPPAEDVLKGACRATLLWAMENGCLIEGLLALTQCEELASPTAPASGDSWGVKKKEIQPLCLGGPRKHVRFVVFGTGSPERNGHIWPGRPAGTPFSATDAIWKFFSDHPR
jgi:hypothetical protein